MSKNFYSTVAFSLAFSFMLVGCGTASESSDNSIELTKQNCEDYLKIGGNIGVDGYKVKSDWYGDFYDHIVGKVVVNGANSNFIYNDVVVTVNLSGTYDSYDWLLKKMKDNIDFSYTVTVKCNTGGNGSESFAVQIADYTAQDELNIGYQIVDVTGTVTVAK